LTAEFDGDLDGLLERVARSGSADATAFLAAVEEFVYEHGSRGPNEWDIYQWSYETQPLLLLHAIERARGAGDDADPVSKAAAAAAERARVIARFEDEFAGDEAALGSFRAAVHTIGVFMAARERCKSNNIRAHGEVRMCFSEIGRRMTEAGHLEHSRQIFMLLAGEIDDFLADPASFTSTLREREQDYLALYDLEPPYIVDRTVPPLSQWSRRGSESVQSVEVGDILHGVGGSPGTVTGTARVLLDLADPSRLEPGDILVTTHTDPSWTPLFLAAGGVVTNIGAVGTHAVIVSRELGIPCVPSIADATRRIPDGATITVDGSRGTVTIDALPA
jgi:phosphohistidine swiveling domain-containing protein